MFSNKSSTGYSENHGAFKNKKIYANVEMKMTQQCHIVY